MSIVVEDGSIVDGANSYVSVADLQAYANARNIIIATDESALLLKAMDYLETFDGRFKGSRVTRDQPLSWPRSGATIEGWVWAATEIPRQVINAQISLCIEIAAGEDPHNPSAATLPVVREKVDTLEVEYANPGQALKVSKTQPSSTHIRLLLNNSGLFAVRA